MPEPVRSGQRYLPGLDGLRALAVLAVAGLPPRAELGAGRITRRRRLLHAERLPHHRPPARPVTPGPARCSSRLLAPPRPAAAARAVRDAHRGGRLGRAAAPAAAAPRCAGRSAAAAAYVSNWWLIAPAHLVLRPVRAAVAARPPVVAGRGGAVLPGLAVAAAARPGAVGRAGPAPRDRDRAEDATGWPPSPWCWPRASAAAMTLLYHPGYDPTRVYDGTDTRAFALLIGAALAFVWPSRKLRARRQRGQRLVPGRRGRRRPAGHRRADLAHHASTRRSCTAAGWSLLSLATVLVVAAVAAPASRVGRVLGVAPLRWIGVRSYGIYLWHFPIIVLTTPADGQRSSLAAPRSRSPRRIVVAALSWHFVEEPIRHGALGRWWTTLRRPAQPRRTARQPGRLGRGPPRRAGAVTAGAGVGGGVQRGPLAGAHRRPGRRRPVRAVRPGRAGRRARRWPRWPPRVGVLGLAGAVPGRAHPGARRPRHPAQPVAVGPPGMTVISGSRAGAARLAGARRRAGRRRRRRAPPAGRWCTSATPPPTA